MTMGNSASRSKQPSTVNTEKLLEAALDGGRGLRLTEFQITQPPIDQFNRFLLVDVGMKTHRRTTSTT